MERLLGHPGKTPDSPRYLPQAQRLVASNLDDPDQIYGWICWNKHGHRPALHYIYVKLPFRQFGVAKLLLMHAEITKATPMEFTHLTTGLRHLRGYLTDFNPYRLWS